MKTKINTAFIVGAGFSANAGLPLQSDFTRLFLSAAEHTSGRSRHLMPVLEKFVRLTFGFQAGQDVSLYPELEDLFTTLDLSANTGHHLGPQYPPKELRKLRRMLLSRIIRMLNFAYSEGLKHPPARRDDLLAFLRRIDHKRHSFVSLNWDTVLERCLEEIGSAMAPSYGPEVLPVGLEDSSIYEEDKPSSPLRIAKVHGSINWLYCDCCRRTYAVHPQHVLRLAGQVLQKQESKKLYNEDVRERLHCPHCEVDLSVRLATFSFRKALRTPSFEGSWLLAEKQLRRANRWVFIGYSLPHADFEFKYLLKRIELARQNDPPKIVLVTKLGDGNTAKTDPTILSYKRFFGEDRLKIFSDSLRSPGIDSIFT